MRFTVIRVADPAGLGQNRFHRLRPDGPGHVSRLKDGGTGPGQIVTGCCILVLVRVRTVPLRVGHHIHIGRRAKDTCVINQPIEQCYVYFVVNEDEFNRFDLRAHWSVISAN